jgi:hypothetical protein
VVPAGSGPAHAVVVASTSPNARVSTESERPAGDPPTHWAGRAVIVITTRIPFLSRPKFDHSAEKSTNSIIDVTARSTTKSATTTRANRRPTD